MTEQRYRAVLEVESGVPVTEVAERFGVSRQAVHRWIGWYREEGLGGLAGRAPRRWPTPTRPGRRTTAQPAQPTHPGRAGPHPRRPTRRAPTSAGARTRAGRAASQLSWC